MAQQTKREAPGDQASTCGCTDSLVRTVASKLLHYQLERGRRRTARETMLLVVGLLVVAAGAVALGYNWSAIVGLFDAFMVPSHPTSN